MIRILPAWVVHILTASGSVIALLTLGQIHNHNFINALWLMGLAIFIDAIDGTLARALHVKALIPTVDGALLDNIIDYLNYVVTPCFFLWVEPELLASNYKLLIISIVCFASSYQFTQNDAKTEDHFFKGFPCYWNLVVMYLYLFSTSHWLSTAILVCLSILVFIPIKYVYPSRLDYLTKNKYLKALMFIASMAYGIHCLLMIYLYPNIPLYLVIYSIIYIAFYLSFSLLRTISPLLRLQTK